MTKYKTSRNKTYTKFKQWHKAHNKRPETHASIKLVYSEHKSGLKAGVSNQHKAGNPNANVKLKTDDTKLA